MTAQTSSTTLGDARRIQTVLAGQWIAHLKVCRDCRPLTHDRNRYCPDGWVLAKRLAAAKFDADRLAASVPGPQLELF